jgi:glycosyltransferase involved in cell wall biosynthesis
VRADHLAHVGWRDPTVLSMKASKETVLAIIPAYREERFIAQVVRRVLQYVQGVLVVDDGSPDNTGTEAEAAGAKVIRHSTNFGKGAALKTGLDYAVSTEAPFFLFLDGDGQHDPSDIPALIHAINGSSADLVVGNRMSNLKSMPLIRRWTNQFMSWQIGRICNIPIPDSQCGFRLARRELLPVLMAPSNRFDFESESMILAVRHGFLVSFVPIRTIYTDQHSKIRPLQDTVRYLRLIRKYRRQLMETNSVERQRTPKL